MSSLQRKEKYDIEASFLTSDSRRVVKRSTEPILAMSPQEANDLFRLELEGQEAYKGLKNYLPVATLRGEEDIETGAIPPVE